MNMISNGAFRAEMDSSNKQNDLVSKLVTAWEKKNSKVARAGGVSLMALSLAACGDADDTPFSQADVDAASAARLLLHLPVLMEQCTRQLTLRKQLEWPL